MSRPLRVEYEGACYHVISRGNRREVVFNDASDCGLFLDRLVEFADIYGVVIYSYCLMPNHFHLHIRTIQGNLSKFMQSFLTSFTIKMNRRHLKSGHLFQGRFKAQLVESELYKNKLSRYIHLNPVKIKECEGMSAAAIKARLMDYKWSSYRFYTGLEKKPSWLDRRFVLASWGGNAAEKIRNYVDYVEKGIKTDNADDIRAVMGGSIIGSEAFKEKIVRKYLSRDVADIDTREQPILAKANFFTADDVLGAVCARYQIKDTSRIMARRGRHAEARKIAIYLIGKHCRGNETLTSLAALFGVKISGFNMARDRAGKELLENASMRNNLAIIQRMMRIQSNNVEV